MLTAFLKRKHMNDNKREVIVISRVYSNGLAVARSLGAAGYTVYYIASSNKKGSNDIVRRSKYVRKFREVVSAKEADGKDSRLLINAIMKFAKEDGEKPLLFTADDFTTSIIDNNRDLLSEHFLMPFIEGGKQGDIAALMNKTVQGRMASDMGLCVAETYTVFLSDDEISLPEGIPYPCYVKPVRSIEGYKTEMKVCHDEEELREHLAVMRMRQSGRDVIVQEFLEIEQEYASAGVCLDQTVILPALIKKESIGKHGRGVTLTGELVPFDIIGEENCRKAIELLKSFHYNGNFGMEFALAGGKIYFNEVNLRSAGESYAYFRSGCNLPAIFADRMFGDEVPQDITFDGIGKTLMYEKIAWDDYLYGHISREELDRYIEETDLKILFDDDDPRPGAYFVKKSDRAYARSRRRIEKCVDAVMFSTGMDRETALKDIEAARESTGISFKDYRLLRFWEVPEGSRSEEYVRRKKELEENKKVSILTSSAISGIGVARALGASGFSIDYFKMVRNEEKEQSDTKCRYIDAYYETKTRQDTSGNDLPIVDLLMDPEIEKAERSVLLPLDEYGVYAAYTNRLRLGERYIVPFEMDSENMNLDKMMSRTALYALAEKKGLKVPHYIVYTLSDEIDEPEGITYPCIIKPDEKLGRQRRRIRVCEDKEELLFQLKSFKTKYGFKDIIIQDVIGPDCEIELPGIYAKRRTIAPAVIRKTRTAGRGKALNGVIEPADRLKDETEKVTKMLRNLGYTGFFIAEFFIAGDDVWFNEIYFACSRNIYALYKSGLNLPELLVNNITGKEYDPSEEKVSHYGYSFVNEEAVWKEYSINRLSSKEFKEAMSGNDLTLLQDDDDPEPYRRFSDKKNYFNRRRRRRKKNQFKAAVRPHLGNFARAVQGYPQGRRKNRFDPDAPLPRVMVAGRNWCSNLCMAKSIAAAGYEVEILHVWQKKPGKLNLQRYVKPEKHSDMIKAYYLCNSLRNSVRIVDRLKELAHEGQKMLLVPVDDLVAFAIDEYYDDLKDYYILPNINGQGGEICRLMSKEAQKNLAIEAGLPVAKGTPLKYESGELEIPDTVTYPCFIKPNVSRNSFKTTMMKCESKEELTEVLEERKARGFDILIEDYIEIKRELSYLGLSTPDGVICPGYFEAVVEGSESHRGVALMGRLLPAEDAEPLMSEVVKFIESLNYTGLFDVDLIEDVNGKVYFVELNLRYGGSGFALTKAGMNLPAMYADYMIKGIKPDPDTRMEKTGQTFANEKVLIDEYVEGIVSLDDIRKTMKEADIHFLKDEDDMRPYRHLLMNFHTAARIRREKIRRKLLEEAADQE